MPLRFWHENVAVFFIFSFSQLYFSNLRTDFIWCSDKCQIDCFTRIVIQLSVCSAWRYHIRLVIIWNIICVLIPSLWIYQIIFGFFLRDIFRWFRLTNLFFIGKWTALFLYLVTNLIKLFGIFECTYFSLIHLDTI